MIPSPLGLRLDPSQPVREQIREAARLGAKGVVVDAVGDLAPDRLSETGRRELRHVLRTVELRLIALHLPTRRAFDTTDQLDERLRRTEGAFAMGHELGTSLVLARVGGLPAETAVAARETFLGALRELGRRADYRGVRLAIETGPESGESLRGTLNGLNTLGLAASVDPNSLLQSGYDPIATIRALGPWVVHAYAPAVESGLTASLARRSGSPSGGVDWLEYLAALEEVNYRGDLTAWPDPSRPAGPQFAAIVERFREL